MNFIECMQGGFGNVVIALFIMATFEFIIILILVWILKNNFKKGDRSSNERDSNLSVSTG